VKKLGLPLLIIKFVHKGYGCVAKDGTGAWIA